VQTIFQFGLDDIAAERMTAILLEDEKSTAKNTPRARALKIVVFGRDGNTAVRV
jgi:hypothetical protein